MREVRGANAHGLVADSQIDVEFDVDPTQVHLTRPRSTDADDADGTPVEGHTDSIGIELDGSDTHCGENAAPIGIGTEKRCLDQAVAGDRPGADQRIRLGRCAANRHLDPLGDALGVCHQLIREIITHGQHCGVQFVL
eukprot:gene23924-28698_t